MAKDKVLISEAGKKQKGSILPNALSSGLVPLRKLLDDGEVVAMCEGWFVSSFIQDFPGVGKVLMIAIKPPKEMGVIGKDVEGNVTIGDKVLE